MTTTYTKSLSSAFGGNLNTTQLLTEITADGGISPTCITVMSIADVVDIVFDAALSGGEQTTLDGLISAHTPSANTKDGVDAQHAYTSVETSTTSKSFIDLDSMALTTSNNTATTYALAFTCVVQNSKRDNSVHFVLNTDGSDMGPTERKIKIKSSKTDNVIATACLAVNVTDGKVIKIRYKTTGGTVTVSNRVMTIYGVY